jgi:hypothetical protein
VVGHGGGAEANRMGQANRMEQGAQQYRRAYPYAGALGYGAAWDAGAAGVAAAATGAAIGAAATSWAAPSYGDAASPAGQGCATVPVGSETYFQCGSGWYMQAYGPSGPTFVPVSPPH